MIAKTEQLILIKTFTSSTFTIKIIFFENMCQTFKQLEKIIIIRIIFIWFLITKY